MKIIIECGNAVGASEQEIRYTLMDALAEFQSSRGPSAEEYVKRRYPESKGYEWLDRKDKVRQVNRRKHVAEEMRNSIISIENV